MQIELVGCTSAGKSTLAEKLTDAAGAQGVGLLHADEFALNQIGVGHLRKRSLRAVVTHLVAFWGCTIRGWRHREFILFAYRQLRHAHVSTWQRWNQLRKVLKQLGRYESIRSARRCQKPVLVDEGTLHAAHNLFVHVGYEFDESHLREFAERVPLPDVVIYVRQHEDVLVKRTLKRGHPRISKPTDDTIAQFVHQATLAFEQLSEHERIAPRMIVVQDGVIVSEPKHLATPQTRYAVELLHEAFETGTPSTSDLELQPNPATVSGAV